MTLPRFLHSKRIAIAEAQRDPGKNITYIKVKTVDPKKEEGRIGIMED